MDNPVIQASLPAERFLDLSHPGDLLTGVLTPFQRKVVGDSPPYNVRRVDEKHNAVRQADSGFGADARADPARLP